MKLILTVNEGLLMPIIYDRNSWSWDSPAGRGRRKQSFNGPVGKDGALGGSDYSAEGPLGGRGIVQSQEAFWG